MAVSDCCSCLNLRRPPGNIGAKIPGFTKLNLRTDLTKSAAEIYNAPLNLNGGVLNMKGGIYPTKYGFQVRFGRKLTKHFKERKSAERFLNGVRFKTDEGSFDLRDYQKDHPLGFATQAEKWLDMKRRSVRKRTFDNYQRYMTLAVRDFGQKNVKHITYGDLEDFLFHRTDISEKTRANMASCLSDFYNWLVKRERIKKPEFPEIKYELGWRNIIDLDTQQKIIEEVRRISWAVNPKIYIGIRFLATYPAFRPVELVSIKEKQIDLRNQSIIIPHPKEKIPKIIYLLDVDTELLKSVPRGLPELPFFRHDRKRRWSKCISGKQWSRKYLYYWWTKACQNLGIKGIDLYGGTRHSTTTALGKICTPEEVQDATGHTSKAFQRYFQDRAGRALKITKRLEGLLSTSNTPLITQCKKRAVGIKTDG